MWEFGPILPNIDGFAAEAHVSLPDLYTPHEHW